MSQVTYEQLLAYYKQVPHNFWMRHWKHKNKYHSDSFKMSYNYKEGFGHGWECWFIEEHLLEDINKKEK